jgi:transposase-like protein
LDGAMGEIFVKGVSTAKVGEVIATLTGSHPSASTVSRVFHTLESEYEQWKQRQLSERYEYAFADGTYFTVIYHDEGCKMPILAVVGIATSGEREVLAFRVGDRENQRAWEDLFDDLKARGVKEVGLWISDGNQAMINAMTAKFAASQRQRCVMHKMENVLSYVPQKQRDQVEPELKALFYQKNRQEADQAVAACIEQYQRIYPTAIECLQRDLEACLTFYAFPKEHWKTLRTNNVIERLFGEVKRRSHKMAAACREMLRRLKESSVSQDMFADMWIEEAKSLLAQKRLSQAQYELVAVSQGTLSRILRGERPYNRLMVMVWARVWRKWYNSEYCRAVFAQKGMSPPVFRSAEETLFVQAAGFQTEEAREQALKETAERQAAALPDTEQEFEAIRNRARRNQFGQKGQLK